MNGEFLVRTPVPTDRANIVQRGRKLQYLTIAWNSLECVIALVAGFLAGSIALVGFGFDSAIEVTSSVAALWRLRWDADELRRETAERHTLRVIGGCFLLLAASPPPADAPAVPGLGHVQEVRDLGRAIALLWQS